MTQAQPHIVGRFRGVWRSGEHYAPHDVCAVGPRSFECHEDHVSGARSQPVSGDDWPLYWSPSEGYVKKLGNVAPFPVQIAAAPVQPVVVQAPPVQLTISGPQGAGAAPDAPSPYGAVVAAPQALPDAERQELEDASSSPLVMLLEIDALRKKFEAQEQQLKSTNELVVKLAERFANLALGPQSVSMDDDPIRVEAWRRKAIVLGVETRADAEQAFHAMLGCGYRLLRKRDKGETWTSQEAARAAVLDTLHDQIDRIDQAAAALANMLPEDMAADRHWPRLGDTA